LSERGYCRELLRRKRLLLALVILRAFYRLAGLAGPGHDRGEIQKGPNFFRAAPPARTNVTLVQADEAKPENGYFCEWMAYQVGQAAMSTSGTFETYQPA
jgi:hypothetical protein